MNFTFPENKVIYQGRMMNISGKPQIYSSYSMIDILKPEENIISIDKIEYFFTYLDNDTGRNKGGNSIILKLYERDNIDESNIEYDEPDRILKISKAKKAISQKRRTKSEKRFENEIKALKECKKKKFQNVINIYEDGTCKILNPHNGKYIEYLFYTMEYASEDLKNFIEKNFKILSIEEKVKYCLSLSRGIEELRELGYYHRDIKPDNIFMVDGMWKVGDLGLLDHQDKFYSIDDLGEPIGPRGWMSPESMNKYLCEKHSYPYNSDFKIDHQSDIFQLGKVFWYIFQHNAPIGCFVSKDFRIKNNQIFSILKKMLNHSKTRRYKKISQVINLLKPVEDKLLKSSA
jgi:serine/threonine protein kinase